MISIATGLLADSSADWSQNAQDWEATCRMLASRPYRIGEPVVIRFAFTNRAEQTREWLDQNFVTLRDFDIRVADGSGNLIPLTAAGEASFRPMDRGSLGITKVTPGGTIEVDVNLTKYFRIDSNGRFTVTADVFLTDLARLSPLELRENAKRVRVKPMVFEIR